MPRVVGMLGLRQSLSTAHALRIWRPMGQNSDSQWVGVTAVGVAMGSAVTARGYDLAPPKKRALASS